jgi:putative tricarboxylic transport membrane protein
MRTRSVVAVLVALAAVLLVPPVVGGLSGGGDGTQLRGLRFLVPNAPGGGYDITARTAAKAMEDGGITGAVEVFNLPGAGGTVGLGRTVNESGNDRLVMSMGLGVVGSVYTNESPATLTDTTPIARLTEETEIVVVSKDSPLRTFDDLVATWTADPGAVPVGGGSSPGGPDHLAPMLWPKASGSTRVPSTTSPTTAAASCSPPCSAGRWRSASPGSASTPTRSRPASCECWR